MKIATTRFGEIDIREDKIIHMPHGMLGFPDSGKFAIFQHKPDSPFYWFQSIDNPTLAFVITNPFLFKPDYDVDVAPVLDEMDWDNPSGDHLELSVVVNIPKGSPEKITANLIGPILINHKVRQAVQMVISNSDYTHKYPLMGPH